MLQRPARAGLSPLRLTAIPGPARTAVARRWRRTPATEEAILTTVPIASGRLVRAHLIVILLLAAGHLVTQWLRQVEGFESVYGLVDFFDLANEGNLPTFFSTWQLLLCAAVMAVIAAARFDEQDPFRWHWASLAVIGLYLAIDEAAGIHELLIRPTQQLLPSMSTGLFYWAWVIPAVAGIAMAALAYLRFAARALPRDIRRQLIIAVAVFLGGAIVTEMFEAAYFQTHGQANMVYAVYVLVEETLEMIGELIALHALIRYWRREIGPVALLPTE